MLGLRDSWRLYAACLINLRRQQPANLFFLFGLHDAPSREVSLRCRQGAAGGHLALARPVRSTHLPRRWGTVGWRTFPLPFCVHAVTTGPARGVVAACRSVTGLCRYHLARPRRRRRCALSPSAPLSRGCGDDGDILPGWPRPYSHGVIRTENAGRTAAGINGGGGIHWIRLWWPRQQTRAP